MNYTEKRIKNLEFLVNCNAGSMSIEELENLKEELKREKEWKKMYATPTTPVEIE